MILACDVGGTKTNVALVEAEGDNLRVVRLEKYESQAQASLDEIIAAFVGPNPPQLEAAGFGVAGPVSDYRVETTNLPWTVHGVRLATALGLPAVSLINDVEALAWSVSWLGAADQIALQARTVGAGNVAVIAAGTGLGMSALLRDGGAPHALAGEGGHADFAPGDETEIELLRFLRHRFGRVSAERVLSGPGLVNVYDFVRSLSPAEEPDWLEEALSRGGGAACIGEAATEGRSALAERAVLLFLAVYGAEAGNWALRTLATGGVWLGGGVAHRLLVGGDRASDHWRARARDAFLTRFRDKGRLSPLLDAIPVQVIVSDLAPLFGAARVALTALRR